MKKFLVLLFSVLLISVCDGQVLPPWLKPNNAYGIVQNRGAYDSTLLGPTGCGAPTSLKAVNIKRYGQYFDSCNHRFYLFDPKTSTWDTLHLGISSSETSWALTGNSGTNPATNFLGTIDSVDLTFKTKNTEILRIKANGNVGIGTAFPNERLHVLGNIRVSYFGQNTLYTNGATGQYYFGDYDGILNNTYIEIQDASQKINFNGVLNIGTVPNTGSMSSPILVRNGSTGDVETVAFSTLPFGWSKTGESSTTPGTNFLGTTNNVGLMFKTNNIQSGFIDRANGNVSLGYESLLNNTIGINNVAFGDGALKTNTIGDNNIAIGKQAMFNNDSASRNTIIGYQAGYSINSYGAEANVAVGYQSLLNNTEGYGNVGLGAYSLQQNSTGTGNTGIGTNALNQNNVYSYNTAVGYNSQGSSAAAFNTSTGAYSLLNNTTGEQNSAFGVNALIANTTGSKNQAFGAGSLESNTTGWFNSAFGHDALLHNIAGYYNVGFGWLANSLNENGNYNTGIGASSARSLKNGDYNTFLGYQAGYHGSQEDTVSYSIGLGDNSYTTRSRQLSISDDIKSFTFRGVSGGVPGWVLTDSLGNGEYWVARPAAAVSSIALSNITAATASNTINNAAYAQNLQWNSLINGFGLNLTSNTTVGTNNHTLFNVGLSGANSNSNVISYAAFIGNTHSGTNSTNVGLSLGASGGTNNYALLVPTGSVGIGTTSPDASAILEMSSTTKGVKFPTLTTTQQNAISSPATGLIIWNSDSSAFTNYNGTAWLKLGQGGSGGGSSLTSSRVGFGGSSNTLVGSTNFIYDSASTELRMGGISDQGAYQLQLNGPQIFRYGTIGDPAILLRPSGGSDPYSPQLAFQSTSVNTAISRIGHEYGGYLYFESASLFAGFGTFGTGLTNVKIRTYSYTSGSGADAATIQINNPDAAAIGLSIKPASSATGDLLQLKNSGATVVTAFNASGQLIIGGTSVNSSASLEVSSTTKGFLPPRMTATQAEAISSPAEGLLIYSTNGTGSTITSKGWWGYDGGTWVKLN